MSLRWSERHRWVINLYWNNLSLDGRIKMWMCLESWYHLITTHVNTNLLIPFPMVCMSAPKRITRSRKSYKLSSCWPEIVPEPCTPGEMHSCPQEHMWAKSGVGERPRLFGRGMLCAPQRVTMRERTLTTEATLPYRTPSWVCQLTSVLPSWAILRLTLKVGRLGFFLLFFIVWVRFVIVEVNCGLHWETGQHFFPRTLQILLALWNG